MSLIEILKGMPDGPEAIQANFAAIGLPTTGTNQGWQYIHFTNGFTVAWKEVVYTDLAGWTAGKSTTFSFGTLPFNFADNAYTDVNAYSYDSTDVAAFSDFKLNLTKINPWNGTVYVEGPGSANATTITTQCLMVGMADTLVV